MAGVCSSKTVGSTTYKYDTLSGKVMRQSWGSNVIDFVYDENNQPYAMRYNGTVYYYLLNAQGDVVGLLNSSGAIAAKYTYDPWGKVTVQNPSGTTNTSSSFIGNINPLRYRGYYYDTETGFYYLQSRYYDPAICRFINADEFVTTDVTSLLGGNMFAYCLNNPVNMIDCEGESPANIIGGIIGGVAGAGLGILLSDQLGLTGWKKIALVAGTTIGGAVLGALVGPQVAKIGSRVAARMGTQAIPKFGSQIGRLGKLVKNTKPTIKGLTRHGAQRMAQRSVSQSMAQSIVRSGYAVAQNDGKTLYFTQEGVVVLNKVGEVVTAYLSKDFDPAVKEIVRQFYG